MSRLQLFQGCYKIKPLDLRTYCIVFKIEDKSASTFVLLVGIEPDTLQNYKLTMRYLQFRTPANEQRTTYDYR